MHEEWSGFAEARQDAVWNAIDRFFDHLPEWVPLPATFLDALGLVRLGGDVADPGLYSVSELHALPATVLTASYLSAGQPVSDTYSGVLLTRL